MSKTNINRRIGEVLRLVGISAWQDKKIGSFSTGMARRLVIAQALLHEPKILILDEPVLGLDPKGMKDIRNIITSLRSENKTVFLSSHLLHEVGETCTKVVLLDKGRVVFFDTVDNLRNMSKMRKIDVELLGAPAKEQIMKIRSIKLIQDINFAGGNLRISFDGRRNTSSQILAQLVSLGLEVVSYQPQSTTLEEVYISMVSEESGVR